MPKRRDESFLCPSCGADVPAGAPACPECGSDDETGWSDQTMYDGLDLPNEDADDDPDTDPAPTPLGRFWTGVAVVVLVAFLWLIFRRGF
ncbi:MAG: zinc-ribbon domain-containing protein [Burkholderiales bacterium]|nr:zinc-ribbon domain-containing protein [Phycisphaerae bacterium]